MFIFLDESGDLGFNFNNPSTSQWFTITLLVCQSYRSKQLIEQAIKRTVRNKVNLPKNKNILAELKGTNTTLPVKKYFFKQIKENEDWKIYSILLNKKNLFNQFSIIPKAEKIYNILARKIIEKMDFSCISNPVRIIVDRCKRGEEIQTFNSYLKGFINSILPLDINIFIEHQSSQEIAGLQAVDLFSWGIYKKYEDANQEWYKEFKTKIISEEIYQYKKDGP